MQIVANFNPSISPSGSFNINLQNNQGKMIIYNESSINIQLTFSNNYTAYVPAWMAMVYCFHNLLNPVVSYTSYSSVSGTNVSISQVVVETYDVGEPLPGTFPVALVRQLNTGNVVLLAAANIVNDNNPAV